MFRTRAPHVLTPAQVWGGNSSRHPSGSSATSIPDSSMSHLNEPWGSRSVSGTWEDVSESQQKELPSLVRGAVHMPTELLLWLPVAELYSILPRFR